MKATQPYQLLAAARARRRLTLAKVAEAIGMSGAVYHRIESGERGISVANAKLLGEFFGIKPAVLIGLEEEREHVHEWDKRIPGRPTIKGVIHLHTCQCGAWKEVETIYPPMGHPDWMTPISITITKKSDNA